MEGSIFIACSKPKRTYPCKARDMYLGVLFKKRLRYALDNFKEKDIYILSGKYGILSLNDIISYYEHSVKDKNKKEYINWQQMVLKQIESKKIKTPFYFLAPKSYTFFISDFDYFENINKLKVGQQNQKFNQLIYKGIL